MSYRVKTTRLPTIIILVVFFSTCPTDAQQLRSGTEFSSVDAIPTAGIEEAFATYEPETGNIYLSVGSGLNSIVLKNLSVNSTNLGRQLCTEFSRPGNDATSTDLSFINLSSIGFPKTGRFNLGPILPADLAITTAQ